MTQNDDKIIIKKTATEKPLPENGAKEYFISKFYLIKLN